MSRASGGPDMPKRNKNDVPYLLRAISMETFAKDGNICNDLQNIRF